MKTNTKIIMALGILAAFMMVAVPFVAVSDDASAVDSTNKITTDEGVEFDFADEVKIAITIYLFADSSKLTVSTYAIEAFAGDDYGDILSNVVVNGVNKRITFTGWYNALNEKVTSGVTVPDVTDDITLYAHFTETAKPAAIDDSDNGYDYSLVIAFVVLVISIGFLAYVVKKR